MLSLYWFLALGALGTFFPFYTLYLKENAGLDAAQVGAIMAVPPLIGILAQPAWGLMGDRSGSRTRVLTLVTFGAAVGYALLYFARDFATLLAGTAVLALFASSLVATCVAVTFALLAERGPHAFGLVRVWGTIGYLLTVVAFPAFLALLGPKEPASHAGPSEPSLALMLPVSAALTAAAGCVSLLLPSQGAAAVRAGAREWRALLGHGPFVRVLFFMFASYVFLHGPIVFFPVYIRSLGGSVATISTMWIVMLLLEIPLVALSGAGFQRLGARALLAVGAASGAARWLVCAWTDAVWLIFAVQLLHGVTVAGLILGAPLYVESVVPDHLRSTAQGLLAMVSTSLGGIASSLLTGWLIEIFGPVAPAHFAGVGALVLTLAVPVLVPAPARHAAASRRWPGDTLGTETV